jgi:A/G-specific adenine glycosylase
MDNHTISHDAPALKYRQQFRPCLHAWFNRNQRRLPWRQTRDPYCIWVSEVMLQQTQVATVVGYYDRFLRQFPDMAALAASELQSVLQIWQGLGYYARVRNLRHAVRGLVAEGNHNVPDHPATFRQLKGVGDYICAAVQSIAFGHRLAAVDGNVRRVLARLCLIDAPVNRKTAACPFDHAAQALLDPDRPGNFNQAMMELGALICRPRDPRCRRCPVNDFCLACRHARTTDYPRRIQKPAVPLRHQVAAIIVKHQQVLITRRPPTGLLGGLWEFPGDRISAETDPQSGCIQAIGRQLNLQIAVDRPLVRIRHAYTHFKVIIQAFGCHVLGGRIKLDGPTDFAWVAPAQFSDYPMSRANQKIAGGLTADSLPAPTQRFSF